MNSRLLWKYTGNNKINIVEFNQLYPVLPEIFTIVGMVKEISGKDIDFQIHEKLPLDATIKIARSKMPKHILKIKANQVMNINEMIAHECGHVFRMFSVKPPDRKIPCSTSSNSNIATAELDTEECILPDSIKNQMYETWINGLVMQVNNLPADARIEKWIFDSFPGLRQEQEEYLRKLSSTCFSTLTKDVERVTTPKVFRCSMAMVYAFLKSIGVLIGVDFSKHFDAYPEIVEYGKVLYKFLEEPDKGYLQDIETTNYWAKILGLSDWYSWIDFEDVPESYYE